MKIYNTKDGIPVNSRARAKDTEALPPFNFPGPLSTRLTGSWAPRHGLALENGYITAQTVGQTGALIMICRDNAFEKSGVLAKITLDAGEIRALVPFNGYLTIGPGDLVYAASFTDSGHESVVIQLHGYRI